MMDEMLLKFMSISLTLFLVCNVMGVASAQTNEIAAPAAGVQSGSLDAKLAKVREEIAKALADSERKDNDLRRYENFAVYTNSAVSRLYQDIVALEKEIQKKRKAIGELTRSTPDGLEKNKAWLAARHRLDALRQEESVLVKQMSVSGEKGGDGTK